MFEQLKERLQQVFYECNQIWHPIATHQRERPDSSWPSAWDLLRMPLKAALRNAIRKEQPRGLSSEHTHQIHNVARMLVIEAIREHHKMDHHPLIRNPVSYTHQTLPTNHPNLTPILTGT